MNTSLTERRILNYNRKGVLPTGSQRKYGEATWLVTGGHEYMIVDVGGFFDVWEDICLDDDEYSRIEYLGEYSYSEIERAINDNELLSNITS